MLVTRKTYLSGVTVVCRSEDSNAAVEYLFRYLLPRSGFSTTKFRVFWDKNSGFVGKLPFFSRISPFPMLLAKVFFFFFLIKFKKIQFYWKTMKKNISLSKRLLMFNGNSK